MNTSKRVKVGNRFMTYRQFADLARDCHEMNYANRGDRYATEAEIAMHRDDPLAFDTLVLQNMANQLDVDVDELKTAIHRTWQPYVVLASRLR